MGLIGEITDGVEGELTMVTGGNCTVGLTLDTIGGGGGELGKEGGGELGKEGGANLGIVGNWLGGAGSLSFSLPTFRLDATDEELEAVKEAEVEGVDGCSLSSEVRTGLED